MRGGHGRKLERPDEAGREAVAASPPHTPPPPHPWCYLPKLMGAGLLAFTVSLPFPPKEIRVALGTFSPPRPPMVHMRISYQMAE